MQKQSLFDSIFEKMYYMPKYFINMINRINLKKMMH